MPVFGKRPASQASPPAETAQESPPPPENEEIAKARKYIEENRADDPLVHMKVTAQALNKFIYDRLNSSKGAHIESFLAILGSLAGFACLLPVWRQFKAGQLAPDDKNFLVVETADGGKYFFGDRINQPLLQSPHSVTAMLFNAASRMGADMMPDVVEMVRHVSTTVGTPSFGIPRLPPGKHLNEAPEAILYSVWPSAHATLSIFTQSEGEFPLIVAIAIEEIMAKASATIAPDLAAKIVLECAIPMAHIDPDKVLQRR
jgi:hypothetical protein